MQGKVTVEYLGYYLYIEHEENEALEAILHCQSQRHAGHTGAGYVWFGGRCGLSPYKDCKRALRLHDGGHADSHDCQHAG